MAKDLNKALGEVDITYDQIIQMSNDILADLFQPIDETVEEISKNIENLSIEMVTKYMLDLQIKAFRLSELRDKAAAKAECAEAVRKEAYAKSFIGQEGTATVKESNATLEISENIIVETLHELVSSLVKTKVDHTLRMIDTLKSILYNRMQEVKINNNNIVE